MREIKKANRELRRELLRKQKAEQIALEKHKLETENDRMRKAIAVLDDKTKTPAERSAMKEERQLREAAELSAALKENCASHVELLKVSYSEFFERLKHFWGLLIKLMTLNLALIALPFLAASLGFEVDLKQIEYVFPILGIVFALTIFFLQCSSEAVRLKRAGTTIRELESALYPEFKKPELPTVKLGFLKFRLTNKFVRGSNSILVVLMATAIQVVLAGAMLALLLV